MTTAVVGARTSFYISHVNPQWERLLDLLEMNVEYETCLGTELFTADGRRILDFLSGYCVHNIISDFVSKQDCRSIVSRAGALVYKLVTAEVGPKAYP